MAALCGLAKKLKTVQFSEIMKARLEVESLKFKNSDFYREKLEPLAAKIVENQARFEKMKQECANAKDLTVDEMKAELELLKIEIEAMKKKWRVLTRYYLPHTN